MHGHHTRAWKYYGVRPEGAADRPELTDEKYCVWDEPHGDYLYTDAWVRKLVKDLRNPLTFKLVTGTRRRKLSPPKRDEVTSAPTAAKSGAR